MIQSTKWSGTQRQRRVRNAVALVLYLGLVALGSVCLFTGQFGGATFVGFLLCVSLLALALYGFERIKVLDLRNLKVVLSEMREVEAEVAAKAAEVREAVREVAESVLASAVEVGRGMYDEDALHRLILAKRDRAERLFREAGLEGDEIEEKLRPVGNMIFWDMVNNLA